MHPSSLIALELPKVLDWLAGLSSFTPGRERALAMVTSDDLAEVGSRLQATGEALALLDARPALHLGGARDIRPAVGRAALGGMLAPAELLEISDTLAVVERWQHGLARLSDSYPLLSGLVQTLEPERPLRAAIANAIGEDGQVLDTAS